VKIVALKTEYIVRKIYINATGCLNIILISLHTEELQRALMTQLNKAYV
jgi:hypothetical protein